MSPRPRPHLSSREGGDASRRVIGNLTIVIAIAIAIVAVAIAIAIVIDIIAYIICLDALKETLNTNVIWVCLLLAFWFWENVWTP